MLPFNVGDRVVAVVGFTDDDLDVRKGNILLIEQYYVDASSGAPKMVVKNCSSGERGWLHFKACQYLQKLQTQSQMNAMGMPSSYAMPGPSSNVPYSQSRMSRLYKNVTVSQAGGATYENQATSFPQKLDEFNKHIIGTSIWNTQPSSSTGGWPAKFSNPPIHTTQFYQEPIYEQRKCTETVEKLLVNKLRIDEEVRNVDLSDEMSREVFLDSLKPNNSSFGHMRNKFRVQCESVIMYSSDIANRHDIEHAIYTHYESIIEQLRSMMTYDPTINFGIETWQKQAEVAGQLAWQLIEEGLQFYRRLLYRLQQVRNIRIISDYLAPGAPLKLEDLPAGGEAVMLSVCRLLVGLAHLHYYKAVIWESHNYEQALINYKLANNAIELMETRDPINPPRAALEAISNQIKPVWDFIKGFPLEDDLDLKIIEQFIDDDKKHAGL